MGNQVIGQDERPFVVAELSGNHNGEKQKALDLVDAAAKTKVHAIKIQTYTAETMTIDHNSDEFKIIDSESLWSGRALFELYEEAHTPWEWHEEIFSRSNEFGVPCFSSPFDLSAVDFLETLNVPAYKIASFECFDLPLVRKVAATMKPLIISTGLATLSEISKIVETVKEVGNPHLVLLKCTSTYPASPTDSNVVTIAHLRDAFDCLVGISDHTLGIGVPLAAVSHGACFIEKHFTLDRNDGGVDSAFSLEPHEFSQMVDESKRAKLAQGKVHYGPTSNEEPSLKFRRSLYAVQNIKKGETITKENVRSIRPGYGVAPAEFDRIEGLSPQKDIPRGTPIHWDFFHRG